MPAFIPPSRHSPISWEFQITNQGFVSRYGKLGSEFFRQYLPFGIEDTTAHPPKKIDPRLYELARQKANTQSRLAVP